MAAQAFRELAQTPNMGAFMVAELQMIDHYKLDLASIGRSCRGLGDSLASKRADHFAERVNDWSRVCAARGPPFPHEYAPKLVPVPPPRDSHISRACGCGADDVNG